MVRGPWTPRRFLLTLLGAAVLGVAAGACIPASRHSMLRWSGWAIVADDALAKADVIVIAADSLSAGYLEAADLVNAGYATRVAIFDSVPTKARLELARRGVNSPAADSAAVAIRILNDLGAANDLQVLPPVIGTVDEGRVLQQWCAANSIHSVLFVSVADHSRRARRVLDRALGRQGVRVMVRYARFSEFDPDLWWHSRSGQRTELTEVQKLLLDLLAHPL